MCSGVSRETDGSPRTIGSVECRHSTLRFLYQGGDDCIAIKPRSHAIDLPKKVRALALRHALSAKAKSDTLIVLDNCEVKEAKTKELKSRFSKLGFGSVLIIDGATVHEGFAHAARNLPQVDVLPVQGINVYDILRRDTLVLTRAGVEALEARLK